MIDRCWWKWGRAERANARMAMQTLSQGAVTQLNRPMPALVAKNAHLAYEYCEELTNAVAEWVKK